MIRRLIFLQPWISASTAILILRLALAIIFIAHGSQKLLGLFGGFGLAGTIASFGKQGIPAVLAYAAIFAEFFGGFFVLLGLLTRLGAFAIGVNMVVAILKVHLAKGFFNPGGFEFPMMLLFSALVLVLYGPGLYSLDALLFERRKRTIEISVERRRAA